MREVSKDEFREVYFRYARDGDGWTKAYWQQFYERDRDPPMRYKVELPNTPDENRMMIVDDFGSREHRLFFMSENAEERLFEPMGGGGR